MVDKYRELAEAAREARGEAPLDPPRPRTLRRKGRGPKTSKFDLSKTGEGGLGKGVRPDVPKISPRGRKNQY